MAWVETPSGWINTNQIAMISSYGDESTYIYWVGKPATLLNMKAKDLMDQVAVAEELWEEQRVRIQQRERNRYS